MSWSFPETGIGLTRGWALSRWNALAGWESLALRTCYSHDVGVSRAVFIILGVLETRASFSSSAFNIGRWLMTNPKYMGRKTPSGSRTKDPGRGRDESKHTWCSASTFRYVANFFSSWAEVLTSLSVGLLKIELCKIFLLFRTLWRYRL